MLERLRNKRGEVGTIVALATGAFILLGFIQTATNGTLKKNGQTIWCKMQGKGNDVCDAKYR